MAELDNESAAAESGGETKPGKAKPTKNLPTDRVGFDTQLGSILRSYAKASEEQGRGAVSNNDVARFAGISVSSVSTCNPFFNEVGLLLREGLKQRPVEAVFAFDQAVEWGSEKPGSKLAPVIAASWFGKALLAKLAIRPTSRNEALAFLAEECRATPDYKVQLELLLQYLEFCGLIAVEGNMVSKVLTRNEAPAPSPAPAPAPAAPPAASAPQPRTVAAGVRVVRIALPSNADVTIELPEGLDADDWILVADQLAGYIRRWKKYQPTPDLKRETDDV